MIKKTPPILTSETAIKLLNGKNYVSLDLGLTKVEVSQANTRYWLNEGEYIDQKDLLKITEDNRSIYFVLNKKIYMIAIAGKHFYKLVRTDGVPTLEIDGIRMHRTKDTTPEDDTARKLEILDIENGVVLDTCMGLGYTAIKAKENGADYVISLEYESNVIRIAQLNPWSLKLFTEEKIHKIIGDSFYILDGLPKDHFNYIIHDPPRHSSAGHLYGLDFYKKLFRVIKHGGKLFHYIGEPRSRYRGVNIRRGVTERLTLAGFTNVEYYPDVMGVICLRPTV
jgi:predicted methyltransferase